MPIDKSRYPVDWPAISLRIRQRDHWRCRVCGVPNRTRGWRDKQGTFHPLHPWEQPPMGRRVTVIVLTVAHVGENKHDKMDTSSLLSLCQGCHLMEDLEDHMHHARATRTRKRIAAAEAVGQQTLGEDNQ